MRSHLQAVQRQIVVCCILHNIAETLSDEGPQRVEEDDDDNGDGDEEPEEEFPEEDDMDIDPVGPHQECTFDLQSGGETSGPESGGPDFESQQGNGADDRGVEGRSPIEKIGEGASFEDDESEVRRHPKSLAQGCPRLDVSPKSHRQPWYGVPQLVLVLLFFHTGGQRTPYWRRLAPSAQVALRC